MAEADPQSTGSRGRFLSWLKTSSPPRKQPEHAGQAAAETSSVAVVSSSLKDAHPGHPKLQKRPKAPPVDNAFVARPPAAEKNGFRPRPLPVEPCPMEASKIGIAISAPTEPSHASLASPGPGDASRDPKRKTDVFHTGPFHPPGQSHTKSSIIPRHSRSQSLGDGTPQLTRRMDSVHNIERRASASFNAKRRPIYIQRSPVLPGSDETAMAMMDNQLEMPRVTETTWKSSHPAQPVGAPLVRTYSDTAMYMPVRRRSLIRTPGVATRAEQPTQPLSSQSSQRSARHLTVASSRQGNPGPTIRRGLSPPVEHPSPNPQRAVTPCEAEYKQLGGIKFGSLRITNGAPRPSPVVDSETENDMAKPPSSVGRGHFDQSTPSRSLAVATPTSRETQRPTPCPQRPSPRTTTGTAQNAWPTRAAPKSAQPGDDALNYAVAEVLHVREDPNAKPSADKILRDLECKTLKTLQRSDSGFVSSPSSDGSQKTVSKLDSGYGSSASLRSLRSFTTAMTSRRSSSEKLVLKKPDTPIPESKRAEDEASFQLASGVLQQKASPGLPALQGDVNRPTAQRTLSFTSMARSSGFHLPSLRHSKSRELRPSRSVSRSGPSTQAGQSSHMEVVDENPTPALAARPAAESSPPSGKLERLLSSKRKGPPKVRGSQKGERSSRVHPSLRTETSKETLMTIMSVGSTELLHPIAGRQKVEGHDARKQGASQFRGLRRMSFRNAKESITNAATTMLASGKPADAPRSPQEQSLSQMQDQKPTSPKTSGAQRKTGSSGEGLQHSMSIPSHKPTSSSASATQGSVSKRQTPKPYAKERSTSSSQLRDDGKISPPAHIAGDMDQQRKSKSPPPVSMRTRSGQNLRAQALQPPTYTQQTPTRRPSLPRVGSGVSYQGQPPSSPTWQMYHPTSQTSLRPPASPSRSLSARHAQPTWQSSYERDLRSYQQRMGHHRRGSEPLYMTSHVSGPTQSGYASPPHQHMHSQSAGYHAHSHSGVVMSQAEQQMLLQQASQQLHASVLGMQSMPVYQHHGAVQPTRSHQGHRRSSSTRSVPNSQGPPFRVLHSYHSPAYRGVPIWG